MNKRIRIKGNIEIVFVVIAAGILIVIISAIYLLASQINISVLPIKQDLFYIVQNAYLSLDNKELEYSSYYVDESILMDKIQILLMKNHENINIESLAYDSNSNKVNIKLKAKIKPVIMSGIIGEIDIYIYDKIKVKLMDVN